MYTGFHLSFEVVILGFDVLAFYFFPSCFLDRIFGESCKTQEVYEARTKNIVAAAVCGFNGTVNYFLLLKNFQPISLSTRMWTSKDRSTSIIVMFVENRNPVCVCARVCVLTSLEILVSALFSNFSVFIMLFTECHFRSRERKKETKVLVSMYFAIY